MDIILTIALLTLFSKNFFGLLYHEVAGLAVLLPILIHILINVKMIRGMCRNFKRVPTNIKVCLIVDILLLMTFIWMGISGVLISRTILTEISTTNALVKLCHMSFGGLSVILMGIHIGLHICRKEMRTGLAILLTILALAGGVYGIGSSGIMRWISMPFVITGSQFAGDRELPTQGMEGKVGFPGNGLNGNGEAGEHKPEFNEKNQKGQHREFGNKPGKGFDGSTGQDYGNGSGRGFGGGSGQGLGKGQGNVQGQMNLRQKVNVLVQFLGIMFSCAMITYWIVILKKKRSK